MLVYLIVGYVSHSWRSQAALLGMFEYLHTMGSPCEVDTCCFVDLKPRSLLKADLKHASVLRKTKEKYAHLKKDSFSVVINTFRGRDSALYKIAKHYSMCRGVDRVIISWNDVGRAVPSDIQSLIQEQENILVDLELSSNLTNRFLPRDTIRTAAVMTSDDDLYFGCDQLEAGFKLWKENENFMVGYAPRRLTLHAPSIISPHKHACYFFYFYEDSYDNGIYNTIFLTKGGFSHIAFFDIYHADQDFSKVRDAVNKATTAEDILMSFIHTLYAGPDHVRAVESVCDNTSVKFFDNRASLSGTTSSARPMISSMIYETLHKMAAPLFAYGLAGETSIWGIKSEPEPRLAPRTGVTCMM